MKKLEDVIDPNVPLIILSIYEEYTDLIVSGTKKYEYRKRFLKEQAQALIYVSKGGNAIKYLIKFKTPEIIEVEKLCKIYYDRHDGPVQECLDYYQGLETGVSIEIEEVYEIEVISIDEFKRQNIKFHPPQSYTYVNKEDELYDYMRLKNVTKIHL